MATMASTLCHVHPRVFAWPSTIKATRSVGTGPAGQARQVSMLTRFRRYPVRPQRFAWRWTIVATRSAGTGPAGLAQKTSTAILSTLFLVRLQRFAWR